MNKPSWAKGGCRSVFPYLAETFGLKTFIETGTGNGETLAFMALKFDNLYSFETNDFKYEVARDMFQFVPKIHLLHESSSHLGELLKSLPVTPTMFYLDAHGIPGEDDGPLAEEIRAIQAYRPDGLVVIDDVGQNTHHDLNLSAVRRAGVDLSGWTLDHRFGRVLFMHRDQFNIPDLGR